MKKILIFGNLGSGKSTLASRLSAENVIPHLDLDLVCWAQPGIRKSFEDSLTEINEFMKRNTAWVIEGCYGSLIEAVATECTEMHFLNPGIEVCLKNNLQRPWEPHKYASKDAQDENLQMLQAWVRQYEKRDDDYSLQYHQKIFDQYAGIKQQHLII